MFGLGTTEIVVILLIVLVLFGGRKLPELGRGMGEALRGFKDAFSGNNSQSSSANVTKQPPQND